MTRIPGLAIIPALLLPVAFTPGDAQAVELHYKQPNFYDQSRALKDSQQPPPADGWPQAIQPQITSPRQSPRSVNPSAIDGNFTFQSDEGSGRVQNGQARQICQGSGTEKPQCRWYEYNVPPPGAVPYRPPAWNLLPEDYKPEE